jgi:uncharacterized membrane protein YfcA
LLGTGKLAETRGTSDAIARFIRHVRLDWGLLLPAAGGAFTAALVGAWLATGVSPERFRALVPLLLSFVLVTLLNRTWPQPPSTCLGRNGQWLAAGTAGIIGLYDGFFGRAGSFLVFLFVRLFGLDFLRIGVGRDRRYRHQCALPSLFGLTGELYWLLGLAMSVCNIVGAQFGSHLAIRRGSAWCEVFIVVVFALITKTAWTPRMHL